jgi:L-asparaginase
MLTRKLTLSNLNSYALMMFGALLLSTSLAHAQDAQPKLPSVMILATGGTIAGTGADSTTTVGYTAATVGAEKLIAAVPELKKVANVKDEQVFQIAEGVLDFV